MITRIDGRYMNLVARPLGTGYPAGPYPFNGDVRCLECGELTNRKCWFCRTPREGVRPDATT
jgi:hypothetical protein